MSSLITRLQKKHERDTAGLSATQDVEETFHTDLRRGHSTETRSQCKFRRDFGILPSCHIVKTYELIFFAIDALGYAINDTIHTFVHDIMELFYARLKDGLSIQIFNGQFGSLENTIRSHFSGYDDQSKVEDFIAKIKFLQEFAMRTGEENMEEINALLERVTNRNFEDTWRKINAGKEYFILFTDYGTPNTYAVHYFICGHSVSEDAVKIYSAWGSSRVQNAFKSMQISKKDFYDFVESINRNDPLYFRDFLMKTMLRPENERFGLGTVGIIQDPSKRAAAYAEAERNIQFTIKEITAGGEANISLFRVPAYNDRKGTYLQTIIEVLGFGINNNLFKNSPRMREQVTASGAPSFTDDDIVDHYLSIDSQFPELPEGVRSNECDEDPYAVNTDADAGDDTGVGGARKTRKNKITRRIRRHIRGNIMKKQHNIKRKSNKVQTQRIIKRKKPKSKKLVRHHIVKK